MRAVEQLIILLLGSSPGPIPSAEHLQKEAFILSQVNPKLAPLLRFEAHHRGPYSARLQEVSQDPLYHEHEYAINAGGSMELTAAGKKKYDEIVSSSGAQEMYDDLVIAANLIRHMYDRLTVDELLFLICDKYPEYTSKSGVRDKYKDPDTRRRLATSLIKKEIITGGRFEELVGNA